MFTKRHEQELAEIKALTHELSERFEEILKRLEHIQARQDALEGNDLPAAEEPAQSTAGAPAAERRRKRDRPAVQAPAAADGSGNAAGAKKARRRQAPDQAEGAAARSGKRQRKGGNGGKRRQREATATAEVGSDDVEAAGPSSSEG